MRSKDLTALSFREMKEADLPSVHKLDQQSFSNPWPENAFHYELLQNQTSVCMVAEVADEKGFQIIGSSVVWVIVDEAHVAMLAVAPAFRGLGIARRLLALSLIEASKRGATKSLLEVRKNNTNALHLYYGLGYTLDGIRPGYYPDNHEDALLLSLVPLELEGLKKQAAE